MELWLCHAVEVRNLLGGVQKYSRETRMLR